MGKKLIIKGAEFTGNGIVPNDVDVTGVLLANLRSGTINDNGNISANSKRVSGQVMPIGSIWASAGDTIKVISPDKVYVGIRYGSGLNKTPNNYYWYGSDDNLSDNYRGDTFRIPTSAKYIGLTFALTNSQYASINVSTSDIQAFIDNKTLIIKVIKNEG